MRWNPNLVQRYTLSEEVPDGNLCLEELTGGGDLGPLHRNLGEGSGHSDQKYRFWAPPPIDRITVQE